MESVFDCAQRLMRHHISIFDSYQHAILYHISKDWEAKKAPFLSQTTQNDSAVMAEVKAAQDTLI